MMRANSWADDMMDYLENKGKENWSHEDWEMYYNIEESWDEDWDEDDEEDYHWGNDMKRLIDYHESILLMLTSIMLYFGSISYTVDPYISSLMNIISFIFFVSSIIMFIINKNERED